MHSPISKYLIVNYKQTLQIFYGYELYNLIISALEMHSTFVIVSSPQVNN